VSRPSAHSGGVTLCTATGGNKVEQLLPRKPLSIIPWTLVLHDRPIWTLCNYVSVHDAGSHFVWQNQWCLVWQKKTEFRPFLAYYIGISLNLAGMLTT